MKRGVIVFLILFLSMIIIGCGINTVHQEVLESFMVELNVVEQAAVGEEVELLAFVTANEKPVTDADEVVFEIWAEGEEDDSIMIEYTDQKDGFYSTTTSFDEEGVYIVQVHVTAKGMHMMPKTEIVIGNEE